MRNPPFIQYQKDAEAEIQTELFNNRGDLVAGIRNCSSLGYICIKVNWGKFTPTV